MTRNYNLILYQKIERAFTNNSTIQLDVNKDGINLDSSETADYQSLNENIQITFYDQSTQYKRAILADSAWINFNRKQTKILFCFQRSTLHNNVITLGQE